MTIKLVRLVVATSLAAYNWSSAGVGVDFLAGILETQWLLVTVQDYSLNNNNNVYLHRWCCIKKRKNRFIIKYNNHDIIK